MAYHIKKIERGTYGNFSKIKEEFLELEDAVEQNNKVLALCEIADLFGAIEGYLQTHAAGISIEDILKMMTATKEAFLSGERKGCQANTSTTNDPNFSFLRVKLSESRLTEAAHDALWFLSQLRDYFKFWPSTAENDGKITLFWEIPNFYADVGFIGDRKYSLYMRDRKNNRDANFNEMPISGLNVGPPEWFTTELKPILKE